MNSGMSFFPSTRRGFLHRAAGGLGGLALAGLLGRQSVQAAPPPLAARASHFVPRAKRLIFLFMEGAMSGQDTFDYKEDLQKNAGKTAPGGGVLTPSKFAFRRHGESGFWFSELLPNIAKHADRLCWLRGLHTDTPAHPQAVVQLHTGAANAILTRPSMGSWLFYGLGTENEDLPGYISINPSANFGGAVNYGSAFLPAHFQGSRISDTGVMPNLKAASASVLQRRQLDLIQEMNRDYAAVSGAPDAVRGVIESSELAFRMQGRLPEVMDFSREPQAVLDAYGVKDGPAGSFARQCLMARRLSEAGVRFVEICHPGWDHHSNLHKDSSNAPLPWTRRPGLCSRTSPAGDSWRIRWCYSVRNSVASPPPRARMGGTITSPVIPCSSPGPG